MIAIVSKAHCEQAKPAHSSGKKLIDCADLIIDNQCPPGDCIVELEGLEWRTGPVSTITGATIINMIRCATAEALLARGREASVVAQPSIRGKCQRRRATGSVLRGLSQEPQTSFRIGAT